MAGLGPVTRSYTSANPVVTLDFCNAVTSIDPQHYTTYCIKMSQISNKNSIINILVSDLTNLIESSFQAGRQDNEVVDLNEINSSRNQQNQEFADFASSFFGNSNVSQHEIDPFKEESDFHFNAFGRKCYCEDKSCLLTPYDEEFSIYDKYDSDHDDDDSNSNNKNKEFKNDIIDMITESSNDTEEIQEFEDNSDQPYDHEIQEFKDDVSLISTEEQHSNDGGDNISDQSQHDEVSSNEQDEYYLDIDYFNNDICSLTKTNSKEYHCKFRSKNRRLNKSNGFTRTFSKTILTPANQIQNKLQYRLKSYIINELKGFKKEFNHNIKNMFYDINYDLDNEHGVFIFNIHFKIELKHATLSIIHSLIINEYNILINKFVTIKFTKKNYFVNNNRSSTIDYSVLPLYKVK